MALRHVVRRFASTQPRGLYLPCTFNSASGFRSAASCWESTRIPACLSRASSSEGVKSRTRDAPVLCPALPRSQRPDVIGLCARFMSGIGGGQLCYGSEETGLGSSGSPSGSVAGPVSGMEGGKEAAAGLESGSGEADPTQELASNDVLAMGMSLLEDHASQKGMQEGEGGSSGSEVPEFSGLSGEKVTWPGNSAFVGNAEAAWRRSEDEEDGEGVGGVHGGMSEEVREMSSQLEGKSRKQQAFLIGQMLKVKPLGDEFIGDRQLLQHMNLETKLINVNRVDKVTKGGRMTRYSALVVMGNRNGVVGFGKGKASEVAKARNKAVLRALKSMQYFERYQNHTIFHDQEVKYGATKLYLWPARSGTGMRANYTVGAILRLAGFKDVKSKVIGSHNPHNTVKATFKALGLIQTPEDIARMRGRTVIERPIVYK